MSPAGCPCKEVVRITGEVEKDIALMAQQQKQDREFFRQVREDIQGSRDEIMACVSGLKEGSRLLDDFKTTITKQMEALAQVQAVVADQARSVTVLQMHCQEVRGDIDDVQQEVDKIREIWLPGVVADATSAIKEGVKPLAARLYITQSVVILGFLYGMTTDHGKEIAEKLFKFLFS